jgi:hypothetical protein
MIEDYMIQHSPSVRKKIAEGLRESREGKIISLRDIMKARKRA